MKWLVLTIGLALAAAVPAEAQDYPSRPLRIISPFGPGTATDVTARVMGNELSVRTGQPVVIDNKAGAEGQVGAQAAAAAPADGYTLFVTTQTTQAINQHIYKSLAYDPVKSFAPVTGMSLGAQIVMVRNDLPVKSIADLIALARAQPGKVSFGSGNGSSRGAGELFKIMAKVDLLSVPYKSQPQAIADLLGGRIDVIFSDFITGLPPVRDGRVRGIAVTSHERIAGLDYPTVHETLPGYEMWAWNACYVPAGTPQPIVDRLNVLVREAMAAESYESLTRTTMRQPFTSTPQGLAEFQAREIEKWGEIIRIAGMKEP